MVKSINIAIQIKGVSDRFFFHFCENIYESIKNIYNFKINDPSQTYSDSYLVDIHTYKHTHTYIYIHIHTYTHIKRTTWFIFWQPASIPLVIEQWANNSIPKPCPPRWLVQRAICVLLNLLCYLLRRGSDYNEVRRNIGWIYEANNGRVRREDHTYVWLTQRTP